MSQENVEIVRRAFAEFQHGNFGKTEFFDPSVRVKWLDSAFAEAKSETFETVGLQAASSFMKSWFEYFDTVSLSAERFIDAGDQVVVICAWQGRGKVSGVDTEWPHAEVWTVRGGRVVSLIAYTDPSDAFQAAGLSE